MQIYCMHNDLYTGAEADSETGTSIRSFAVV